MPSSLIDTYVEYGRESTDAPIIYHTALGYFVVSSILGYHVRLVTSYMPSGLAPNLWVLLIGPSRITRKTTAMRLATNVIKAVNPSLLMPASFTPEALYEMFNELNEGDAVVWVKDEMGGFFKTLQKKYMYGVREILSSIYTGYGETRKLRNLTLRIPDNLYVCAVGTMPTPPHEYLSEEDFQSGFMNRWILAYADRRDTRLPLLHQSARAEALFREIVETLKSYEKQLLSGPYIVSTTAGAIEKLEEYDREVERQLEQIEQTSPGNLFKLYYAETPTTLVKMSILRRLSRGDYGGSGIITIDETDVVEAKRDLQKFVEASRVVIDDVQSSPRARPVVTEERAIERIFSYISGKGEEGATYSELLLKTRILSKDLREYLITLVEQDRVVCLRHSSGRGRPSLRFYDARFRNTVLAYPNTEVVTADMLRALLK